MFSNVPQPREQILKTLCQPIVDDCFTETVPFLKVQTVHTAPQHPSRFTWRLSQQVPVALAPRLVCTPDFPFPSRARRQVHTCARALSLSHTHTNASFPKQMAAWGSAAESRLAQAREKVGSAHAHALSLSHTQTLALKFAAGQAERGGG